MYTLNDIQNIVRKIHNEEIEVRNSGNGLKNQLGDMSYWWKGDACESFEQGCLELGYEINKLYLDINDLEFGLRKLESQVQRADDEKRWAEARKIQK